MTIITESHFKLVSFDLFYILSFVTSTFKKNYIHRISPHKKYNTPLFQNFNTPLQYYSFDIKYMYKNCENHYMSHTMIVIIVNRA